MQHTTYMPDEVNGEGLARGYTSFAFGPPERAEPEAREWQFGGGGIYSTAEDLAKWDLAMMTGEVLDSAAFATFSTPSRLADGRQTGYGCGIFTSVNRFGDLVLQHSGRDAGFVAFDRMTPRSRSAVIVLSNRDDVPIWDLANDLTALLNDELRAPVPKVAGAPAKEVAREIFTEMQSGTIDRSRFGDDFNAFLTDGKLASASVRLRALGAPSSVDVEDAAERGGMEQTIVRFTFASTKCKASMFRSVDGKVQQFLLER
jgi:CubicO group peptidase (beta-lactamase class C family)